jgi:hypothetical protein
MHYATAIIEALEAYGPSSRTMLQRETARRLEMERVRKQIARATYRRRVEPVSLVPAVTPSERETGELVYQTEHDGIKVTLPFVSILGW